MSTAYVIALAACVLALAAARLLVGELPSGRRGLRLGGIDVALVVIGLLALAFHCGAMFYGSTVTRVPGTDGVVHQIDALGVVSMIAYCVPGALIIVGLRGLYRPALALVVACLVAVGVTMYDGGRLDAHLAAIFVTVVVLAACGAAFVGPPSVRTPTPAH